MARKSKQKIASAEQVQDAERQIREYSRAVKFTVTEYSFEFIIQKFNEGRYYVPAYQRNFVWSSDKQSKFIESVLMGLPIPFVFFWQDEDGRMEIVDGSQRLRTIQAFMADDFALRKLESLPAANGLKFSNLPSARQLKFAETSIRVIILDNATDAVTRTEMFARINTGGMTANDAEIRRGSLPGPFMSLIISLAESAKFVDLTPVSKQLIDKREREELVTRFFAYLENIDPAANNGDGDILDYKEEPRRFYYGFVEKMNAIAAQEISNNGQSDFLSKLETEFFQTLEFVSKISEHGFTKSETGNQVPRVRFESIAVGSALALRADPNLFNLAPDLSPLLQSDSFSVATKSDAANVKSKLLGRILLVKKWLAVQ